MKHGYRLYQNRNFEKSLLASWVIAFMYSASWKTQSSKSGKIDPVKQYIIDNGGASVKADTKSYYSSFYASVLFVAVSGSKLENTIVHFTPQYIYFTSSSSVAPF